MVDVKGASLVIHHEPISTLPEFVPVRGLQGGLNNFRIGTGDQRNSWCEERVETFSPTSYLWEGERG